MSEALNEQLSALVDDELDSQELPLLLRQLEGSDQLTGRLERYYLMRDAIRRELPGVDTLGLADRVSASLEAEPAHQGRPRRTRPRSHALKPAAGLAIAASVAVLAVSLWPTGPTSTPQPQSFTSNAITGITSQSGTMRVSTGSGGGLAISAGQSAPATEPQEWDRLDPRVQSWLNGYIVDHSEHAGSAQLGGMINYARIAGQEPENQ
ncbi:sigma-E factor negative regulatory protein [Ectothiorhodospiraceae bacterium WFHF3C12]|nr:sigma-E factor negative regulatory protein [Ectothiorhodospiraceae bacterium WFHF3C12]